MYTIMTCDRPSFGVAISVSRKVIPLKRVEGKIITLDKTEYTVLTQSRLGVRK